MSCLLTSIITRLGTAMKTKISSASTPHILHKSKIILGLGIVIALIGVGLLLRAPVVISEANTAAAVQAHKEYLESQVNAPSGEPRDGRDPSTQRQTTLAEAAATAHGNGLRTDKPAAGVSGSHHEHVAHHNMYGDPSKTGVNAAGCFIDYGVPGEQCVPVGLAGDDGVLTCAELRTKFASGVTVSGTDRFHLDHNGDKLACSAGE